MTISKIKKEIVGLEQEIRMVLAALKARLPVMLEGDQVQGRQNWQKWWAGAFGGKSSGSMKTRN